MKKFVLGVAALFLFGSFAASSGAFASTHDEAVFFKNAAGQIDGTCEIELPLFSGTATASTCDMNRSAFESTELANQFPDVYIIDPDEPDAAALNWLENEMRMSIDPSYEPLGITPDFTCMDPPHNCPANVKSEFVPGAVCVVNACGLGACPTCPSFIPGLAIKAWCAYGCMKGSKVVGGCFGFWTRIGNRWLGPYCLAG